MLIDIHALIISQLTKKYEEIKTTFLKAISQLNDEQLNWRPNKESNSIANLAVHIVGNINQRINSGILGLPDTRNRETEFNPQLVLTQEEIKVLINESFNLLISTTEQLKKDDLLRTQEVRGKSKYIYEVLQQCATHYSEHLGQVLYIAKLCLGSDFITTSIYKPTHPTN